MQREATKLETQKYVMKYKLQVKKTIEHDEKSKMQTQAAHGLTDQQLMDEEERQRFDPTSNAVQYNQQNMPTVINSEMGAIGRF